MPKLSTTSILDTAKRAAREAGKITTQAYGQHQSVTFKSDHTIVTKVDQAAEQAIIKVIAQEFPEHGFISEEAGEQKADAPDIWVIDPLDGTSNFVLQLPYWCVSIAHLRHGTVTAAVVYQPVTDQLFAAAVDSGATLNDESIQVGQLSKLKETVTVLGRGSSAKAKERLPDILSKLTNFDRTERIPGSSALNICYTAWGKFDTSINLSPHLHDIAAAVLIAQEAGARITDFDGHKWQPSLSHPGEFLVTNEALLPQIIKLLQAT